MNSTLVVIEGCNHNNVCKTIRKKLQSAVQKITIEYEILTLYLLNNWTLMKENICVNTLRTKNGGTWKQKRWEKEFHCKYDFRTNSIRAGKEFS